MIYKRVILGLLSLLMLVVSCSKDGTNNAGSLLDGKYEIIHSCQDFDFNEFWQEYCEHVDQLDVSTLGYNVDKLIGRLANADTEYIVRSVDFQYESVDEKGNPVLLSARLYVPQEGVNGKKLKGLILSSRFSTYKASCCPTNTCRMEGMFAWNGYAVLVPDLCGFGVSENLPQNFHNPIMNGQESVDALIAAKALLGDLNVKYDYNILNIGYSQGADTGLAALRYAALHPDLGIKFTTSYLGGIPLDYGMCLSYYLDSSTDTEDMNTSVCSLLLVSLLENNCCDMEPGDLLQEPLLSNYKDWLSSKKYAKYEVDELIGTKDLDKIISESLKDSGSKPYRSIISYFEDHSLLDGWVLPQGCELYVMHGLHDDVVPYSNFQYFNNFANEHWSQNQFHFITNPLGSHVLTCLEFLIFLKNYL